MEKPANGVPVWMRRRVVCEQCPRSVITAQSEQWLRLYASWKALGGIRDWMHVEARCADALMMLENEMREEMRHGGK
ncbi:MAG: hypothetical protein HYZ37_10125 [Candidatus Solibacter usitatus]|nr:hypothetical protein [Candidatus Solibacter usitatus]